MRRTVHYRSFLFLFILFCVGVSTSNASSVVQMTTPPLDRTLQDITIFQDSVKDSWAAGNHLETVEGKIPVDTNEMYNGRPSLRFQVTEPTDWWGSGFAGRGWTSFDLTRYYEHGAFEFYVKGAEGGEYFSLSLQDVSPARVIENPANPPDTRSRTLVHSSATFFEVTPEWQHVRIPLQELVPPASDFDLTQTWNIGISVSYAPADLGPTTFWINDMKFTSPDQEMSFPPIKVNQLGYLPVSEKYANISGFADELTVDPGTMFYVKRATDKRIVYRGSLSLVTEYDIASGERVLRADFSRLRTPGTYYIAADGIDQDSPLFKVERDIYRDLVYDASRYYYYQRAGFELEEAYAGLFARPAGTPQDATATRRSDGSAVDVSGGWYDAGDTGKYVTFAGRAVSDLLYTYEIAPQLFGDDTLNIPESGNSIPDLLDEIRWELDWLMRMQDPATGGFYHMVYPNVWIGTPDTDFRTRYLENCAFISHQAASFTEPDRTIIDSEQCDIKPTADTGSAVAMLAHAAVVYRPVDAAYANQLLDAAEYGWEYLAAHPEHIAIPGQNGGEEPDGDNRLWAAATLFRATGEAQYNDYFLEHYQTPEFTRFWTSTTDSGYHDEGALGMLAVFAYLQADEADSAVREWFIPQFQAYRTTMLTRMESRPWRNFLLTSEDGSDSDYFWGSNSVTLGSTSVLAIGNYVLDRHDPYTLRAVYRNLNYILGVNPLQLSYVSGYGTNSVRNIYSDTYNYDLIEEMPKGYMPGGPNWYDGGMATSRFEAKAYIDSGTSYFVNEHAIYYNAQLVLNATVAASGFHASTTPRLATTGGQ